MDNHQSKYFQTASLMDEALIVLLEKKEYQCITVKDICDKAGVNRSTFYLHYQNIDDLLTETLESYQKALSLEYKEEQFKFTESKESFYLFTPDYVKPYLEFLKKNQKLYVLAIDNPKLFKCDIQFRTLYAKLFSPIMSRFQIPEKEKKYVIAFFITGIHAMINEWLKGGCEESVDFMADMIYKYVRRDN